MYGIYASTKQDFLLVLEKFDKEYNVFIRKYSHIKISINEIKKTISDSLKKNHDEIHSVYNEIARNLINKYNFENKFTKIIKAESLEKEHKLCLKDLWNEKNLEGLVEVRDYKKITNKEIDDCDFDWIWIKDKNSFESDIYYYKKSSDYYFSEFNLNEEIHKKFWENKEKIIKNNANIRGCFFLNGEDGSTGVSRVRKFYSDLTVRDLKTKLKHFFEALSEDNMTLVDFIEKFKFIDTPENVIYKLNEEIVSQVYFNKLKNYFIRWENYNIEYKNIKSQNIINCEEFIEDLVIDNY